MNPLRLSFCSTLLLAASIACAAAPPSSAFSDCEHCPRMMVVPAGSFAMGADPGDKQASEDESPRHEVTISKPFALGIYEITRGEFETFVAATNYDSGNSCNALEDGQWQDQAGRTWRAPGYVQTAQHPAVCVSWNDAQQYLAWMSKKTGKTYRLPTEAEWEYVARAGKLHPVGHDAANYGAEADSFTPFATGKDQWLQTAPVGSFAADALGLHDIFGNVWEWIEDCYHETYVGAPVDGTARTTQCSMPDRHSVRGGGWGDASVLLRPSYRLRGPADGRYFSLGFRVARDIE